MPNELSWIKHRSRTLSSLTEDEIDIIIGSEYNYYKHKVIENYKFEYEIVGQKEPVV